MLDAALRNRFLLFGAALPLLLGGYLALNNWPPRLSVHRSVEENTPTISVEELRKSLAVDRQKLLQSETAQAKLRADVIRLRKAYQEGQVEKRLVLEAEQSFVAALKRVHELRHSVTEADIAITEAILGEKVLRLPVLPPGGFSQTAQLTRFNGIFRWSIKETPRIERYFAQTFGRTLPITARGQSSTHNRLGFDHRDAIDVGLHPDSVEGRNLIDYLRKTGIPFLAFRQAIPGAATGPHIHIGKPSSRLSR